MHAPNDEAPRYYSVNDNFLASVHNENLTSTMNLLTQYSSKLYSLETDDSLGYSV